jgi:hypothetical protein
VILAGIIPIEDVQIFSGQTMRLDMCDSNTSDDFIFTSGQAFHFGALEFIVIN